MNLRLRADNRADLPSMENWLNAGVDWTEHHGIDIAPTASCGELFYETTTRTDLTIADDETASLFETFQKESSPQQALPTHPFLKLDTLELCKQSPETLLVRTGSSSMVDSSSNEDDVSEHVVTSLPSASTTSLLDRSRSSYDKANLYMEADSPRGPLSPAATKSLTRTMPTGMKRSFDDLQATTTTTTATSVATAYSPFVAMANGPTTPTTFLPAAANVAAAASAPGILFPTPLTLPNVPSMEEIAQSRPKRRNVRISTDPQSVAARHRRERISDRVRVLQHFVPGGTKMDTASMLDEAIHYVKFLQQQLQALERLGNSSYDPRFMTPGGPLMIPTSSSSSVRPFDLNCAVYQTFPCTPMTQSASPQPQNVTTAWPTTSPFCSQGLQDSIQEQFCH